MIAVLQRVSEASVRVDGDVIGKLPITASHQPGGRQCSGLGDADHFEREVAVGRVVDWWGKSAVLGGRRYEITDANRECKGSHLIKNKNKILI